MNMFKTNAGSNGHWELIDEEKGRKVLYGCYKSKHELINSVEMELAYEEGLAIETAHRLTNGIAPKYYGVEAIEFDGYWYPCIIMEYIRGIVAREYFSSTLDWSKYAKYVKATLESYGVYYNDMNPGNVIITPNGFRVVDWDSRYVEFKENE